MPGKPNEGSSSALSSGVIDGLPAERSGIIRSSTDEPPRDGEPGHVGPSHFLFQTTPTSTFYIEPDLPGWPFDEV